MAQGNNTRERKLAGRKLTRRDAIKVGGATALGLAFSKPIINTLKPPSVWASVSPGPNPTPTPTPVRKVVVTPSDLNGWQFISESTPGGVGTLVSGPGSPPEGSGSARFQLTAANQGMSLQYFAASLVGLPLTSLTSLKYWTYVTSAPGPQAVALQINVDDDVTDGDTGWKGRLVFEPYNGNGTVIQGQWQMWDALAGNWWASGAPINGFAPISSPQSLADIISNFPNIGFNSSFGGLLLKAGSGWSSFDGNGDAITLGIGGIDTIFDFEG